MKHMTLTAARKRAKLSVSETARRAGVRRVTIQRLERGKTLPQYETREALERLFRVPLTFQKAAA